MTGVAGSLMTALVSQNQDRGTIYNSQQVNLAERTFANNIRPRLLCGVVRDHNDAQPRAQVS